MSWKEVVKEALRRCPARRHRFLKVVLKEGRESMSSHCEVVQEVLGGRRSSILRRCTERM